MQLKYKYITKNFFDVFWGDGWDNCIRVKRNQQKNFVILRAYKKPPRDIIKQIELMTPQVAELFDKVKSNLIVLVDMDNDFEGFAQKINRKMKRFDITKFKEENTELYEKYLVDSESTEYKVEYKLARQA